MDQEAFKMSDSKQIPPACEFETDKLLIKLDEVLSSDVTIVDEVVAKIVRLTEGRQCREDIENVDLALREALVNAIIHGNQSNPTKAVRVCVALASDCSVLIIVKDAGAGFDPAQLPNPLVAENLLATHGRGIFLINRLMEDVQFSFDRGTTIFMRRSSSTSKTGEVSHSDDSLPEKRNQTGEER
jgi:anti-sigma regulatory factor (Ser/Thr protein kinase)